MGRRKAEVLVKACDVCGQSFETVDTKRGRAKASCSKSCASKLAYKAQRTFAPCVLCSDVTETAHSVLTAQLPVYCGECAKARYVHKGIICLKEFRSDRNSTKLCSTDCETINNRSKLVTVTCADCGKVFQQASFNVYANKRVFCSKRCNMRTYSRENPSRYGGTWSTWLLRIRERDGGKCVLCTAESPLEVHHFIKLTTFADPNDAHYNDNLVLLCVQCHRAVEDQDIQDLNDFYRRYSPTP